MGARLTLKINGNKCPAAGGLQSSSPAGCDRFPIEQMDTD